MKSLLFLSFLFIFTACGEKSSDSSSVTESAPSPFISIWRTTGPDEAIRLPLRSGFNYDMKVDWGDSTESAITSFDDVEISHLYSTAGDHTVTISGTAEAWYFAGDEYASKIIEVVDLGDLGWKNLEYAFLGCTQLASFKGGNTSSVTNMSGMFASTSALTTLDLSSFDTKNVTNMSSMFEYTNGLTSLDLSSFDTTNVTNMNAMFYGTSNLTTIDLSNLYTSNVTTMDQMFRSTGLTTLDLSNFNTSKVTNMNVIFGDATSLTSLNTSGWDLSNVTSSDYPFYNTNPSLVVTCDQGGSPGTGTFFGKNCN